MKIFAKITHSGKIGVAMDLTGAEEISLVNVMTKLEQSNLVINYVS